MKGTTKAKLAVGAIALMLVALSAGFGQEGRTEARDGDARGGPGRSVQATRGERAEALSRYMDREISKGNLRLALTQSEGDGTRVHERYDIFAKGLRVWGAQLLRHRLNGEVYLINGELHDAIDVDVVPTVAGGQAEQMARTGLADPAFRLVGSAELMIYPSAEGYRLAHKVVYAKFGSRIVTFVDAKTGRILFRFEELQTSSAVGTGTGFLGDTKKMSTAFQNNTYYAIDQMRPAQITTGDSRHGNTVYYVTDDDNNWTSDGTVVDGHAYLGWTYDYFYLVHGRKGMDDKNRELVLSVHVGTNYENAYFDPSNKWMFFGDGNPASSYPFTTALDVVAHEFTHGITDATSKLIYASESGALNEAFSDIMAVSCEFFQQPEGSGYRMAEWWEGEDLEKNFRPGRSLENPSSVLVWQGYSWRYPDHYSKRYILPVDGNNDWGGVHLNSTIPSHWYYLLAHGGTNRTSGIAVDGIGLSEAEKIAYRAWVYYLHPSSNFKGARTASLQAATDLYGAGSAEADATARAWSAVGVN
ncbi:MAG TPA: M4 family metallopeptidase [Acidobacteriota bacterium]|nr:M4 family metallopeptidase [Acidobacteriota bacterium]